MSMQTQFVRFLLVGGVATALQYAILIILVQAGMASVITASTTGFVISAIANYAMNRRFTFRTDAAHTQAFPRFLTVALIGLAINAALIWLLNSELGAHYLVAQLMATIVTLAWNFSLNRLWTFGNINNALETNQGVPR